MGPEMTLSTTPVVLTTASSSYTLSSGNTLSTTGIAITNAFTAGFDPVVVNSGTIRETGTTGSSKDIAIFLNSGDTTGKTGVTNNSTGLISGAAYGIVIGGSGNTNNRATITNFGTILQSGDTGNSDAAIKFSTGTGGAVVNSGLLSGLYGGVYFKTVDSAALSVTNNIGGTITNTGGGRAITFNDINGASGNFAGSSATFFNAGVVNGLVEFDVANGGATATNAGTINGQIFSTGGGGTLTLDAGQKLTGGANFSSGGTLDFAAGTAAIGTINTGAYAGFNSATILAGADFNIGSAASVSSIAGVSTIGNLGTLNILGSLGNTTINMEGNVAGSASVVDFTGSNTSAPLINYGSNDQIVITTLAPVAGGSYQDSYNTATGVLTITELNGAGATIGSSNVTVSGTTPLSTASFVNISGPGGDTVVLGTSTLVNSGSIYIDFGGKVTLAPVGGLDNDPVTFGTHGSVTGLNVLDLNSNPAGSGSVPLSAAISGFGLNDAIIIGPSLAAFAPGDQLRVAYTGGGQLQIQDVTKSNATGTFVGAGINFSPAGNYNANSFVELFGTNGLYIETPATVAEQGFTFSTSGTGNFDNPVNFTGGVAPGQNIFAGEVVSIVAGTASISASEPVSDNGTIIVTGSGSGLIDSAPLSGSGTIVIAGGGNVTLANSSGTDTGTVYFGTGGTSTNPNLLDLTVPGTAGFSGTIANFGTFDTIILGGSVLPTPTSSSALSFSTIVSGGVETLTVTTTVNGTISTDNLTFSSIPPGVFNVSVGPQGVVISDLPCFAAGTRILTPDGQVAVEELAVGDTVLTARDGAERQIIWVGQRSVDLARHAMAEKVQPIRILAGAFGDGLPERDLVLSPDHALFIDGHLIEAKTLVNGVTVLREEATRFVTYHHVELASHDIMLAEGLAAESYLDSGNRVMFESDAAPIMLHPDFAAVSRKAACAPLAVDGDVVIAARSRLLERAVALGFAATGELDVVVRADGVTLTPLTGLGTVMHFALPAGARQVELISSTGVPAEISADPGDRRVLGVAVSGLALIAGGARTEIELDDAAHAGFYEAEPTHRWTNGRAVIALPKVAGGTVLEISIHGQAVRWRARSAA
jgi:hypothetical protein